MASQRRSRGPQRASRQGQTALSTRGGGASYYRTGGTRTVKAGGYQGGKTSGGYYTLATPSGQQAAVRMPQRSYHRIILAEFLACLAMVAGSMILLPAQDQSGGAAVRSFAKELVQLTAICAVFFLLALGSNGPKTGKVAAAFGGLVTLGVAWNLSAMFGALAKTLTGNPSGQQQGTGLLIGGAGIATGQQLIGTFPTPTGEPPFNPYTGGVG